MESSGVRVPPPIYFAFGLGIAIVLDRLLHLPAPSRAAVPIGQLALLAGLSLGTWAFWRLRVHRTTISLHRPTTAIVSDGPYSFTRNPLYIANVLMYLGIALWLRNLWALIFLIPIVVLVDRTVIPKEEDYLERTFGETYINYKRSVRRWL